MRSTLHSLILAPVVLAAAALAPNTAKAETVNVPFNFTVAGQIWPAGLYSVQPRSSSNLVTVVSHDGSKSFSCILAPGAPDPTDRHVTLRFDEVNGGHALKTVQYRSQISPDLDKNADHQMYAPTRLSQGR